MQDHALRNQCICWHSQIWATRQNNITEPKMEMAAGLQQLFGSTIGGSANMVSRGFQGRTRAEKHGKNAENTRKRARKKGRATRGKSPSLLCERTHLHLHLIWELKAKYNPPYFLFFLGGCGAAACCCFCCCCHCRGCFCFYLLAPEPGRRWK